MALRDPPAVADAKGKIIPYAGPSMLGTYTEEMGGQIYFHTIILKSILVDDGKLLSQRMVEMMFTPQLSSQSREAIQKLFSIREPSRNYIAEYIDTAPYDWGLGGMLTLDNIGWGRRKETIT
uniref:Transesterase n=1 Tax=Coccidioides posadasii RMSCC 3488 TaxID=454284 RepID=A0A0J6FPH7_COCPO|nr:transesterase [Coccidioides posadasii RMSCC 3488]